MTKRQIIALAASISVPYAASAAESSVVLTDTKKNIAKSEWKASAADSGDAVGKWSIRLETLHGGKQEGVQVIEVDNGAMTYRIVPTRGFSVWDAHVGNLRLGWDAPNSKEIVHPAYVDLADRGGLGWLNGFGGWVVHAGVSSMGAPSLENGTMYTLHGHIDYTPASFVSVRYEGGDSPKPIFKGIVNNFQMFGPQLQLTTEITTPIGKPLFIFDDTIVNVSDAPQEMESLYHINFGPPLLGAGAEFIAPVKVAYPRDSRAAEGGIANWMKYERPQPAGYTEQAYFLTLQANDSGNTAAMLKAPDGASGAIVRFNVKDLPYFAFWKNEAPSKTGYVTGLEPATAYAYPRYVERKAGRVIKLEAGASHQARVEIEVLTTAQAVAAEQAAIKKLQVAEPKIEKNPLADLNKK